MHLEYDVFLSYNSLDGTAVRQVADALRSRGLNCWFDQDQRPDVAGFRVWLEKALERSNTVGVFIGPSGIGEYQAVEIDVAINQQINQGRRVIPILLPDTPQPELSPFLRRYSWLTFKSGLQDDSTLDQLYFMISGRPAARRASSQPRTTDGHESSEIAAEDFAKTLEGHRVTFFLGGRCSPGEPDMPPLPWAITRHLMLDLELIQPDSEILLPPLDTVGSYYSIKEGPEAMERKIGLFIRGLSKTFPSIQSRLAHLLWLLAARARERPINTATTRLPRLGAPDGTQIPSMSPRGSGLLDIPSPRGALCSVVRARPRGVPCLTSGGDL